MSLLQFFTSQAAPWKRLVAPPIFPAPMEWHWAPRCGRPERGWTDKGMESTYVQRHPKLTEFDLLWFNVFVKTINLIYAKKLYGNYYENYEAISFPSFQNSEPTWKRIRSPKLSAVLSARERLVKAAKVSRLPTLKASEWFLGFALPKGWKNVGKNCKER